MASLGPAPVGHPMLSTVLPTPLAFPLFCFCEHVPLSPMTVAEETKGGS